jgi:hypothetical protein
MKEVDMLAVKMDLLLKRLDERAADKEPMKGTVKAMDSQMTCEVCGEVGHSGNDYPRTFSPTRKEVIRTSIQISIQINPPLNTWS